MPVPPVPETIAFETFLLDPRRRVLSAAGAPVDLHDRAFDMLLLLIERRAGPVSRDDIKKHVWKGLAVSDNNVTVQMSNLRRALEPHGGDGLIITVKDGKDGGYRFVGDVADQQPAPAELSAPPLSSAPPLGPVAPAAPNLGHGPRSARPLVRAGAAVAAVVVALLLYGVARQAGWFTAASAPLTIAVLPFRNLTDGGAVNYMADSITDDLTTDLAHIPGSQVTARGSAEAYRNPSAAGRAGAALNVSYLVTGSLRAAGDVYLINVKLIEAASERELWSDHFETPYAGLAATQRAIEGRIASELDVQLPLAQSAISLHDRPDDPSAQDLFYRGYAIVLHDDSLPGYTTAQSLFERALRRQPNYTDALAELGLTLILKVQSGADPTEGIDIAEARTVIPRSLEQGQNPISLAANARLLETESDCAQAVSSARAALQLEPNNIDALAVEAKCATNSGQFDDAVVYLREVLQVSPDPARSKPRLALLTQLYLLQGRLRDAIDAGNLALAGDPPPQPGAETMGRPEYVRLMIMSATALAGNIKVAHDLYSQYAQVWPNRSAWRVAAYSPAGLASTPGFRRYIAGLIQAGMPLYADDRAATITKLSSADVTGDFAMPPPVPAGVTLLDTAGTTKLLALGESRVFDWGLGAAVIKGAVLVRGAGGEPLPSVNTWLASLTEVDRLVPIVTMGDGLYGRAAAEAARALVKAGFRNVFWYRAGEEGWVSAGLPFEDRRGQ
jgi:TolB-like protein/DNA-binding winged helix-turn-helix (wHTH) protein